MFKRKKVCVDEYTADQLIIYMALAEGTSTIQVGPLSTKSKHTVTQIELIKILVPETEIEVKTLDFDKYEVN